MRLFRKNCLYLQQLKIFIYMKSILDVKGVKTLTKNQQSEVTGGDGWRDTCTAAQVSGSIFQYVLCPDWGGLFD